MAEKESGRRIKYDGELAGGYDVARARAAAVEHAQKELAGVYSWLRGVSLVWEVESRPLQRRGGLLCCSGVVPFA